MDAPHDNPMQLTMKDEYPFKKAAVRVSLNGRMRTAAVVLLSPVATLLGLLLEVGAAQDLEVSRHGLVMVPKAEEVTRGPGKHLHVHYYVKDSFPAAETIDAIVSALGKHGWRAVAGDDLAPYESSSLDSAWDEVPKERGIGLRMWSARWRNAAGDQVSYSLAFSSPQMSSGMEPVYLSVSAWFDTKESATLQRQRMKAEFLKIEEQIARFRQAQVGTSSCCWGYC